MFKPKPYHAYPAPLDSPLLYPGIRPDYSFLLADETVFFLQLPDFTEYSDIYSIINSCVYVDEHGSAVNINKYLQEKNVPILQERYAVIGYGSNPVPGQLVKKFGIDAVVPVLLGTMNNTDIVYNMISNAGYAFAELIFHQADVVCDVGVTFLDDHQLELMIASEEHYNLVFSPNDVLLESGVLYPSIRSELLLFAGSRKIWVPEQYGTPVAVKELPSQGRLFPELNQKQYLELAVKEFNLQSLGIRSSEELIYRISSEAMDVITENSVKILINKMIDENEYSIMPAADTLNLADTKNCLKEFLHS